MSGGTYGVILLVLLASPRGTKPPPSPVVSARYRRKTGHVATCKQQSLEAVGVQCAAAVCWSGIVAAVQ
jgi:hypothetical protein